MKSTTVRFSHILLALAILTSSIVVILTLFGRSAAAPAAAGPLDLSLEPFAAGLSDPVGITHATAGDDRLFVVERGGRIKIVQPDGTVLTTPFLDISGRADSSSTEQGLLGLAFHPNYASNGLFYVNYVNSSSGVRRTRISQFQVSSNPNAADENSEEILLTVTQPYSNHNAGDLLFGPDGYLYIPLGDGGSGGDPDNNAQNLGVLLGKIVRIDVDSGPGGTADCQGEGSGGYSVPADNPMVGGAGGTCDEIWAVGLRNPWRASFDRETGDLYLGDVGQNSYEEIDFQPAASAGGENYGWRCYEGNSSYNLTGCGVITDYTFPIFAYDNPAEGCSVTGGYVYRGSVYPAMVGHYLLTDYCSGNFWDLVHTGSGWDVTKHTNLKAFGYVAFGEDAAGELYVVNRSAGSVHRLVENSVGPVLTISKSGPAAAAAGEPITYTLTIGNQGNISATNLTITDTIPAGATYLPGSGGSLDGPVVKWTVASLAPEGEIQRSFAVTASQTVVNNDYGVTADNEAAAQGSDPVLTILATDFIFLPLVSRE